MPNTLHQLDYTFFYTHLSIIDKTCINDNMVLGLLDPKVSIFLEDTEAKSILGTGKFTHDKLEEGDDTIVLMNYGLVSAFAIYQKPIKVRKVSLLPIKDIYISPGVFQSSALDHLLDSLEMRASYLSKALFLPLPKDANLQSLRSSLKNKNYFTELSNPPQRLRDNNHWSLIAPVEPQIHPTLRRRLTKREQHSIY